jgi:hypothetical protein
MGGMTMDEAKKTRMMTKMKNDQRCVTRTCSEFRDDDAPR